MLLDAFRQEFDPALLSFMQQKLASVHTLTVATETEAMRSYLVQFIQQWKRVRPYLVFLLANESTALSADQLRAVCIAHELVHTFALIHDDVMDQGTTRHGSPTYHLAIQHMHGYTDLQPAMSQAILVGDLVLARATQIFTQAINDPQAHDLFFRMLDEVMIGQSGDIHLSHSPLREKNSAIIAKDTFKSAHYTFCKPLMMGATLWAKGNLDQRESLWISLWLAYQLRDDYMDLIGGHDNKTCFSDLHEGNQTLLLWYALAHLAPHEREQLASYRWKLLTTEEQETATLLIQRSGALTYGKQEVQRLLDEAHEQLTQLTPPTSSIHAGISDLIHKLRI
jgi:geranylgeranyl diphosphate synthase type I